MFELHINFLVLLLLMIFCINRATLCACVVKIKKNKVVNKKKKKKSFLFELIRADWQQYENVKRLLSVHMDHGLSGSC